MVKFNRSKYVNKSVFKKHGEVHNPGKSRGSQKNNPNSAGPLSQVRGREFLQIPRVIFANYAEKLKLRDEPKVQLTGTRYMGASLPIPRMKVLQISRYSAG